MFVLYGSILIIVMLFVSCLLLKRNYTSWRITPDEFLQESLHLVGYSGALGNPLFPPEEALGKIDHSVIREFYFVRFYFTLISCPHLYTFVVLVSLAIPMLTQNRQPQTFFSFWF